jgi:hypothetical protein
MRSFALRTRVSLAAVFAFGLATSSAPADPPPLVIGEVSASMPSGEFAAALEQALREELRHAAPPPKRRAFVLDAKLVKLTAEKSEGSVRATAVVSVALRRARDSTLHALLSGKATAEESATNVQATQGTALRAAVRSALRGLPQAVAAE